jgi:heme/copper-type cytochrome/quinol oxidase subunit 3
MKKWWTPILLAIAAVALGFPLFAGLTNATVMPLAIRDHPWPLEILGAVLTLVLLAMAVRAFRERQRRAVTTVSALVAVLGTVFFIAFVHVFSHMIPAPPSGLGVGTQAADFTLPDQDGNPRSLASFRGKPLLVVFYRGFW